MIPTTNATHGRHAAFIPDPYVPESGNPGYRVLHYDLDLDCKLGGNRLDGRALITGIAETDLSRLGLDLAGLRVSKASVNGAKVARQAQRARKAGAPAARSPAGRGGIHTRDPLRRDP